MDIKADLFEGGFEIFDDLLRENVGIGKIVGFCETFLSEPEDVEITKAARPSFLAEPQYAVLKKSLPPWDSSTFQLV